MRSLVVSSLLSLVFVSAALSQPAWDVSKRDRDILIDGYLEEWSGVPAFELTPDTKDIRTGGEFKPNDVKVSVQALWDEEYLYLALTWTDDEWDIKEVSRKDAVWIDPDKKRRDRMQFFDNFKFHIRKSDYDFTLWVSPRINERGPFSWARLLEGFKGMERATGAPMVSAREHSDRATLEIMLLWKQLRLNPEKEGKLPLTMMVSDGDHPGRLLEYKADFVKWLGWVGYMNLAR